MKTKIFATVGSTYPLDRMIKELDKIAKNTKYSMFAQIGQSTYKPVNIKYSKFLNYDEFLDKIKWADIIVSHAGAGSIIDLLTSNNKFILFPRQQKYGEAIDDHQMEICKAMFKQYKTQFVKEQLELGDKLKLAKKAEIYPKKKLLHEIESLL